ncbi:hypothetical protein Sjap_010273 [Stephania japonica]|uniref:NAD-dependent epimerase/dehydratase domain-containing protein n=1 Tax=Stephania japonica TaxID=461633 RepID=A0AAP0J953_9MAGN
MLELSKLSTSPWSSPFNHLSRDRVRFRSLKPLCNVERVRSIDDDDASSANRMFILGLGFVGQFFGNQLTKQNWHVGGTCRSEIKRHRLEKMGFDAHLFTNDTEETKNLSLSCLEEVTHLLVSWPPIVGFGDPVLDRCQDVLQSRLGNGNLQWLCYLSSTSVYGDCNGAWVDEDYPANPKKASAKARLAAENRWLSVGNNLGVPVQVLRPGGIYGPGRSALDTIIKQEILTENQRMREARRYTSRIHVDDVCQALKATIDVPSPGRIYNVVDDDPAPRTEVFAFASELIDKKWPGKIKASPTAGAYRQGHERAEGGEKRVSNVRMKNDLGVKLLHPTYRSGLEDIIKTMENPFP